MEFNLHRNNKETETTMKPLGVSKQEAAQMMGVSYNTLHNLIKTEKIRCKRIGRRVIIAIEEIRNYLNRD